MFANVVRLLNDENGATLVEYGILVLLIATVSIGVLTALGPKIAALFAPANAAL